MPKTITSPSGRTLHHVATVKTTKESDTSIKVIKVDRQKLRRDENEEYLKNANVKAYLAAISEAEGGGYDFKSGAFKGKKNDPWRFTDFSTHPGVGAHKSSASGMYQITIATWRDHGTTSMGLTDFSPHTQDLIAVDLLSSIGAIEEIKNGNIADSMQKVAVKWASLPQGPGLANKYPPQHYVKYEDFIESYRKFGGVVAQ
jgi:muramidase (phage lysozyme)